MQSIEATITTEDGETHTIRTSTYDLYRAEQTLGELEILQGKVKVTELMTILHSAARRQGLAGDDIDEWLSSVDLDFDGIGESPKAE